MTEKNQELISEGLQRVSEAAAFLQISRSQLYKLINEGILPSVRIGRSIRVPVRAVRELASPTTAGHRVPGAE